MSSTENDVKGNVSRLVLPERMNERVPARIPAGDASPMAMLQIAVQRGDDIEKIGKLMDLAERWNAQQNRQAFNAAFAAFKNEAVKIVKSTVITDGPLKGKKHANLFDVVVATTGPLAQHGLSLSWKLTRDEPQWMEVTCTLRHVDGHSESVSMGAAPDTGPGRNAIQARGSAKSYLERYTATAILGLAAADADDDGAGTNKPELVNADQADTLDSLMLSVKANKAKFLAYMASTCKKPISKIEDIPAHAYKIAVDALNEWSRSRDA